MKLFRTTKNKFLQLIKESKPYKYTFAMKNTYNFFGPQVKTETEKV
jgi:hypothetical protein